MTYVFKNGCIYIYIYTHIYILYIYIYIYINSTCNEAGRRAVTAAEGGVAPRHHGNTEVIIPRRQQISDPLHRERRHQHLAPPTGCRQHRTQRASRSRLALVSHASRSRLALALVSRLVRVSHASHSRLTLVSLASHSRLDTPIFTPSQSATYWQKKISIT